MNFDISTIRPDTDQKKIIFSNINSKIIWGLPFSGKSTTAVWRANYLFTKNITTILICFSSHHRRLLHHLLKSLNINEKIKVLTFREWQIDLLKKDNEYLNSGAIKIFSREEILTWLKSHLGKYTGNDVAENDLEIIWAEKLYKEKLGDAEYIDLLNCYEQFLLNNHAIDEIDLYLKSKEKIESGFQNGHIHFIIDEGHEASWIELQLIGLIKQKSTVEVFIDYNQSIMSWRTPLGPIPFKDIKKIFGAVKEIYLTNNYFNTKSIINLGHKLLIQNKNRISKRSSVMNRSSGEIKYYLADNADHEGAFLRRIILEKISDPSFDEKKIGVLLRNHKQAYEIANCLDEILPTPYFSNALIRRPGVKKILSLLRILYKCANDIDFDIVLDNCRDEQIKNEYFEIKKQLLEKNIFFSYFYQSNISALTAIDLNCEKYLIDRFSCTVGESEGYQICAIEDMVIVKKHFFSVEKDELGKFKINGDPSVLKILEKLKQGNGICFYQGALSDVLYEIPGLYFVQKTPYYENLKTDFNNFKNFTELIDLLNNNLVFINQLKNLFNNQSQVWQRNFLEDLLPVKYLFEFFIEEDLGNDLEKLNFIFKKNYLTHLSKDENLIYFLKKFRYALTASIELNERITICTIHEGRHQVFDMVILPRMHQFEFPHEQSCSGLALEEERRLFYVALMRCRKTLLITSIKNDHAVSQFIHEVGIY